MVVFVDAALFWCTSSIPVTCLTLPETFSLCSEFDYGGRYVGVVALVVVGVLFL